MHGVAKVMHQRVVDMDSGKGLLPTVPLSSLRRAYLCHTTSIVRGSRYDAQQFLREAWLGHVNWGDPSVIATISSDIGSPTGQDAV